MMPAGFVPEQALAFAGPTGTAIAVAKASPLPVASTPQAAGSTPLAGTMSVSGSAGPFQPDLDRPIWLTLSGTWQGSAQMLRSTDGGTTRLPLTIAGQPGATFTGNANEPVAIEGVAGATYYLAVTIASGTLAYGIAQ
jgi:hypothetical protein